MTIRQMYLFFCLYLALLVIVTVLTRATFRRVAGALAGPSAADRLARRPWEPHQASAV